MLKQWRIRGWLVELVAPNGLLVGFSLPDWGQTEKRIYCVNLLLVALLWYRA